MRERKTPEINGPTNHKELSPISIGEVAGDGLDERAGEGPRHRQTRSQGDRHPQVFHEPRQERAEEGRVQVVNEVCDAHGQHDAAGRAPGDSERVSFLDAGGRAMSGGYRARCNTRYLADGQGDQPGSRAWLPLCLSPHSGDPRRLVHEPIQGGGSHPSEGGKGEDRGAIFLRSLVRLRRCLGSWWGAFGAHGLRGRLSPRRSGNIRDGRTVSHVSRARTLRRGVGRFPVAPRGATTLAGWLLIVGIVIFSGSLYTLVLTGQRWLGAVTPVGWTGPDRGLGVPWAWAVAAQLMVNPGRDGDVGRGTDPPGGPDRSRCTTFTR